MRRIHFVPERKHTSGNCGLNHVRAILHLKSHCFSDFVGAIRDSIGEIRFAPKKEIPEPVCWIKVTARGTDSLGRNQHARSGDHALVDRIAQGNIDEFVTANETAAQIAHGYKPGFDGCPGKGRRADRVFGHVQIEFLQPALIVITRKIGGQMRMRIHEARGKCCITQIDYLRVARDRQIAPGIDNLIALNDHHGILHERVRLTVKESRRLQND